MADIPGLPNYDNRPGIPYFHPDLDMSPSKAAKTLMSVARSKMKKGAKRGLIKPKAHAMMPSKVSTGARVFGGGKK